MPAEDTPRLLIIDLENVVGPGHPRQRVLRSRIIALLDAAGPAHHAVAGYAVADLAEDPTASVLAELRVAPLRVPPAPDAAELVLLAHARRIHDALRCRSFLVASADRRFAELADLGRLGLLVWHDQPIAAKLEDAAHQIHRIPRHTPSMPPSTTTDSARSSLPYSRVRGLASASVSSRSCSGDVRLDSPDYPSSTHAAWSTRARLVAHGVSDDRKGAGGGLGGGDQGAGETG